MLQLLFQQISDLDCQLQWMDVLNVLRSEMISYIITYNGGLHKNTYGRAHYSTSGVVDCCIVGGGLAECVQ